MGKKSKKRGYFGSLNGQCRGVGGYRGLKFSWRPNFSCFTAYQNLEQFQDTFAQNRLESKKKITHIFITIEKLVITIVFITIE